MLEEPLLPTRGNAGAAPVLPSQQAALGKSIRHEGAIGHSHRGLLPPSFTLDTTTWMSTGPFCSACPTWAFSLATPSAWNARLQACVAGFLLLPRSQLKRHWSFWPMFSVHSRTPPLGCPNRHLKLNRSRLGSTIIFLHQSHSSNLPILVSFMTIHLLYKPHLGIHQFPLSLSHPPYPLVIKSCRLSSLFRSQICPLLTASSALFPGPCLQHLLPRQLPSLLPVSTFVSIPLIHPEQQPDRSS